MSPRARAAVAAASVLLGCSRLPAPAGAPGASSGPGAWRVVAVMGDSGGVLEGGVASAAFSADGRFAAFGGAGAEVVEIPSRRRVRFIKEARVNGHALALSPDGRLLATAGRRDEVRLWDVSSGAETSTLKLDAEPHAIAFSPRGDLLAAGGENLAIAVWDLAKRRWLWRKGPVSNAGGQVRALAFFSDGRLLLSGSRVDLASGEAEIWMESPRLWDVASAAQIAAFDHGQFLTAASADGRRIVGAGGPQVRVWERSSGREIATLPHFPIRESGGSVSGVGLTPDGARAISLGHDGSLVVWDVAAERELWRITAHAGNAEALAVSPDGRHALTGARDGRARLWDLQTGKEVGGNSGHTGAVGALALATDSADPARMRLWSAGQEGRIVAWTSPSASGQAFVAPALEAESSWNPPPPIPGWDPPVRLMTFARAGAVLLVCERDRVTAVRAASGEKLWEHGLAKGAHIWSIAAAPGPTGRMVAIVGGFGELLDLETGRLRLSLPREPKPMLVVLSPDEKWLAIGGDDGELSIAEAATGKVVRQLAGHAGHLADIDGKLVTTARSAAVAGAFSPDGAVLVTSSDWDHALRFWDTSTGAQQGSIELAKSTNPARLIAFSPDGRLVAVAEATGRLMILDARQRKAVATIDLSRTAGLEGARPRALAFSPDGATLFAGTGRGPIAILRQ